MKKRFFVIGMVCITLISFITACSGYEDISDTQINFESNSDGSLGFDPFFLNPSIDLDMGMNQLISDGYRGRNITIAVLDTGINYEDPRLDRDGDVLTLHDRIVTNHVSFISGEPDYDLNGHGTTIAGLIASTNVTIPNHNFTFSGIATEVNLWSVKVLDKDGEGDEISIMSGLQYCLDHHDEIDIINLSFGLIKEDSNAEILEEIEALAVQCWEAGIVVVAAAGNDGNALRSDGIPLYSISAPSSALELISVGSTSGEGIADFSSIGPSPISDYIKPDLVAPGDNLNTLYISDSFAMGVSGTSYSSPILASGIALLLEAVGKIDPDLVKASLTESAKSLGYTFYEEGAGIPNFTKAVELIQGDFDGISLYPTHIDFPNFFDPEKESVPENTHDLYPEINFEKILVTLIVSKNLQHGLSYVIDDEIATFIIVDNNPITEKGQYAIGIDFVEGMFIKGSAFVFNPGTYEGYVSIYDGDREVESIYITVTISFLGLFRVWWGLILGLFLPFLGLLVVSRKKRKTSQVLKMDIAIGVKKCPKGYTCTCDITGQKCTITKNTS